MVEAFGRFERNPFSFWRDDNGTIMIGERLAFEGFNLYVRRTGYGPPTGRLFVFSDHAPEGKPRDVSLEVGVQEVDCSVLE